MLRRNSTLIHASLSFTSRGANECSLDWQITEKYELSPSLSLFLRALRDLPRSSCSTCAQAALRIGHSYFVTATAMSYTGSLLSRKRYLPMSVSAAAESIASLPTRFLSKYGVASRPWQYNFIFCLYTRGKRRAIYNFQPVAFIFDLWLFSFLFLFVRLQSPTNGICIVWKRISGLQLTGGLILLPSLTREIIIPAILIRIFGPFSNLYLRSTPFQKDTKYLFICTLSPPCNLKRKDRVRFEGANCKRNYKCQRGSAESVFAREK